MAEGSKAKRREYIRTWRAANIAATRAGVEPPVPHGESRYVHYGCTCEVCKAAHSEGERRRRAARKAREEATR